MTNFARRADKESPLNGTRECLSDTPDIHPYTEYSYP